jgi:crotonobetainyl-CoA:carnitine CoA-transferase CaiB-like acyl-CoA transferase
MGVTGEPGTPPMRAGIAVADSSTSALAATCIGAHSARSSGDRNWPSIAGHATDRRSRLFFVTRTSSDWLAALEAKGIPAGPIYKVDAVFADPQICHLNMAVPVQDIERGEVRVVGQPIGLSRTPSRVARGIPEQGEHTQKILSEIFYLTDEIAHLRNRKVV